MLTKKIVNFILFLMLGLLMSECLPAVAQLQLPNNEPIIAPRRPALSPDGSLLAFVYRGDIWTVSSKGGKAVPITSHLALDTLPLFSPDGKWIAFASKRNGTYDTYIIPVEGGEPRRITFGNFGETPDDWSSDGKHLMFISSRDAPYPAIFKINVETGQFTRLLQEKLWPGNACWSKDGTKVFYETNGFPWYRGRYNGSRSANLASYNLITGERKSITDTERQHLWPNQLPNGEILCVTYSETTPSTLKLGEKPFKNVDNAKRTPNLWLFDENGNGKQITDFVGGMVMWPTVARASGDIAFEYDASIWIMRNGEKKPTRLEIFAPADNKQNYIQREVVEGGATELELSPDGKTIAFSVRDEIWTIPVDKPKRPNPDDAKRLTTFEGLDHDFNWSADSKKIYFISDRNNTFGLYELNVENSDIKTLVSEDNDIYNPKLTPDGKYLAYWMTGDLAGLYLYEFETSKSKLVMPAVGTGTWGNGGHDYSFSPDSAWITTTIQGERGVQDLWILPISGENPRRITQYDSNYQSPTWSPDGRYIFFSCDINGNGTYVLPLMPEDSSSGEIEMKLQMPEKDVKLKVEIDFEDISARIRKISSQPIGSNIIFNSEGTFYFINDGHVYSSSFDGKDVRQIFSNDFQVVRLFPEGKKFLFMRNGLIYTGIPNNPNITNIKFSCVYNQDIRLVRKQAFMQLWRTYNRSFYDGNFHGRDWTGLRDKYLPYLSTVGTNEEFGSILSMMIGELEASHSEISPKASYTGLPTPQLGFYYDYNYSGPGIRVLDVPNGAPGSFKKQLIKPGEYVMKVNDKDISINEDLYKWLNELNGKDLALTVNDKPSLDGARTVIYKAVSNSDWWALRSKNRLDKIQFTVNQQSNNRIAYVNIPGMGGGDQARFEREFYAKVIGKDAVIIDVRFNGGGNIADTLISWLSPATYGYYRPRDSYASTLPGRNWEKPMVVLINENSASNAEMFPYDIKQTKSGTVIGMRTPGYVISTINFTLVDGTGARLPGAGVYRLDGSNMENDGEKPDIEVDLTTEDWLAGRDPQLDAAIDFLMKKISN